MDSNLPGPSTSRETESPPRKQPKRSSKTALKKYLTEDDLERLLYDSDEDIYSAFFLTVAIGNCMVKLIPPVNFCSDENIQTIFGTKLEDFLNYRIDYNSIS
jgi:hypothetical protein